MPTKKIYTTSGKEVPKENYPLLTLEWLCRDIIKDTPKKTKVTNNGNKSITN